MSRKQRQAEHYMNQAHQKILNSEAQRCASSIKTNCLIKPKTLNQAEYVKSMKNNVITLASGLAGTGKSLLALHTGISLINNPDSPIDKIFYLRANVGMMDEASLGALPGELSSKIAPLAYPVIDNLTQFMLLSQANYLIESGKIEVLPITFIRGRSFSNAFVFADEIQNLTHKGIKTVLSRVGEGTKMVLAGDITQTDIIDSKSGFRDCLYKLEDLKDIGIVEFNHHDIVRHPIISHILARL